MKINDATSRRDWAKKLVADTESPDALSEWERENFVPSQSVQLRVPLRDPAETRRHLAMIEEAIRTLRHHLEQVSETDRSALLTVRGTIRTLNLKVNAYRKPRW